MSVLNDDNGEKRVYKINVEPLPDDKVEEYISKVQERFMSHTWKSVVLNKETSLPTPTTPEDIEELDKLHGITKDNENTKKLSVFEKLSKLIKK